MADQIQEVFWLTSVDRQHLFYVSPAFEEIWGRPIESLYAYPGGYLNVLLDSIHPSDREFVVAALTQQLHDEYKAEYRIVRPDQSIRWVRSRSFPVQNLCGETWGIVGLSEDITERKHCEELIKQREQEFRILVENASDIISRFDRQLHHVYVNPAIEQVTGIPAQDFIGKTHRDMNMPEPLLSLWEQSLEKVFQTGEADEHEFSYLTPKGWQYYQSRLVPELAADGSVESVVGIARDITKNKQTEEALRESEERFRTVFEFAPLGIAIANSQGRLLRANRAFQEILGYTHEELQNLSFGDITHPDDLIKSINLFQKILTGKRKHLSLEKRYFRKDGRLLWGKISVSGVYDGNGTFQYTIAMLQNITAQKQAHIDLEQAHEELEQRVTQRTAELERANALLRQEIAERKQVEEELKAQKDFLQTVLDTAPNMIWVKDREDRIVLANRASADFFEIPIENLIGKTNPELHANLVDAETCIAQDKEVMATLREKFIPEEAFPTPSGELRWFQTIKKPIFSRDGQVCQVLGVSTDITEHKRVNDALRESEQRYRMLVEGMNDGVIVVDENGLISYVNEKLADMLGYSLVEMIGHHTSEFLDKANLKIIEEQRDRRRKGESGSYELGLQRKDGQNLLTIASATPMLGEDGSFKGSFKVITDISTLKAVEAQLQQANEQLQAVLDAVPGCVAWMSDDGHYLGVNQHLANAYNLHRDSFIGREIGFFSDNCDFPLFMRQFFASSAQTASRVITIQIGGSTQNHLIVAQKYNQGTKAVAVGIDISDRIQAQEALQSQKDFLQTVIDTNPNLIYVKDTESKIILVNQACADFYGVKIEDLLGKTVAELHPHESDVARFTDLEQEVITTLQQKFIPEESLGTLTGEVRWFQSIKKPLFAKDGQVYGVFGVCTDITERKLAQEALRLSEERFRLAIDNIPDVFVIYDAQRRFQFVNAQGIRRSGKSLEEHLGKTDEEVWPDEVTKEYLPILKQAVETNTIQTGECRITLAHADTLVLIVTYVPLLNEQGEIYQILGITHDITDHKQAETQIREALREKEVLLQEIHHRVKNNLQVISSLLDLQSQQIDEPAMLEVFRESCNRVRTMALIHEQLYQSQDCAKINFSDYLNDLTNYLFQAYGVNADKIILELDIDEVSINITTAIPCGLIISELISNAIKHAFPNQESGLIKITLRSDLHKNIKLIIKDNGIGLPKTYNIKKTKSLGLQLVNVLIGQLEGTLKLNQSTGAEFCICFCELIA
ncbi:MAG TPA: PAS domain S-box protein [Coleofasciculaceae cyanobacterium]